MRLQPHPVIVRLAQLVTGLIVFVSLIEFVGQCLDADLGNYPVDSSTTLLLVTIFVGSLICIAAQFQFRSSKEFWFQYKPWRRQMRALRDASYKAARHTTEYELEHFRKEFEASIAS